MNESLSPSRLALGELVRRHSLLAGLVTLYFSVSILLGRGQEASIQGDNTAALFKSFLVNVPSMIYFILLWRLLTLTYVERVPDRLASLVAEVRSFASQHDRLGSGFMTTLFMTATMIAFAQIKSRIPAVQPFAWDETFMQLDRMLHFGVDPYRIVHAILGWDMAISFLSGIYFIWLVLVYFVLLGASFMRPENPLRMQFLIAFVLTWAIGGNLFAMLFSSAGPAYYALLGLGDHYADLMAALRNHAATGAISVVNVQDLLWQIHADDTPLNAISAFPSMHVATSVLMAIFLSRLSRRLGIFAWIFALGIMIGSVLLAWHYAVDGYAGGLIALSCWYLAGLLLRLTSGKRSTRPTQAAPQT